MDDGVGSWELVELVDGGAGTAPGGLKGWVKEGLGVVISSWSGVSGEA